MLTFILGIFQHFFPTLTPGELVSGCLAGDPKRVELLVRRYTPLLRARVRATLLGPRGLHGRLASADDVDDVVQEIFTHLFRDRGHVLRQWDEERGSLEAWLATIAIRESHHWLDHHRAARRGGGVLHRGPDDLGSVAGTTAPADDQLEQQQTLMKMEQALKEELSDKGWLFFQLLYVEELEVEEITRTLGVSRDVVYTWRKRIKGVMETILARGGRS